MADELVLYEVEDGVATVTLNDPEKRNRLSGEMLAQLVEAIRRARGDDDARALVLTGAGKAFCAGADLGGFGADAPPIQKHFGTDHFGLSVNNLDGTIEELRSRGVFIEVEPWEFRPGVRIAFVRGPDDVRIELVETRQ